MKKHQIGDSGQAYNVERGELIERDNLKRNNQRY